MKTLSIVGARPQFIKEAIIQNEIKKYDDIKEVVVHTGQHYDKNMSEIFFEILNMQEPNYNLGIKALQHGEMTGRMLIDLEQIIIKENPDIVLLYGDTNSTLAGALAASKLNIKIAHIESGLRRKHVRETPEETNRVLTDRVSDYLFAPSKLSIENLKKEGITKGVYLTGDVMYDIFLKTKPQFDYSLVKKLALRQNDYIMMTLHRNFNVDDHKKLKKILIEVNKVSKEIQVVLPIHPRTKKKIQEFGFKDLISDIKVIEPIDYLKLMGLTENCYKVITDSGGYQKEAYFAGKQACLLMQNTCWSELVDAGFNTLCGVDDIYDTIMNDKNVPYLKDIYGEGKAAEKIVSILKRDFKN